MHASMHVCVYVCMYVYIYTYMYIYTHTIHMYDYICIYIHCIYIYIDAISMVRNLRNSTTWNLGFYVNYNASEVLCGLDPFEALGLGVLGF